MDACSNMMYDDDMRHYCANVVAFVTYKFLSPESWD